MVSKTYRQRAGRAASLFKLLGSPTRALIFGTLIRSKKCSVMSIADEIDMTHSAVSHQLAILSRAGVVESLRDGRNTCYSTGRSPEAKALVRFLGALLAKN